MLLRIHLLTVVITILFTGNVAGQFVWDNTLKDLFTQQGISETTPIGTILGSLKAHGARGVVQYSSNSTVLRINSLNGQVTLNSVLAYLLTPTFVVRFTASDAANSSNQIQADVVVKVLSTNNHAPVLDLSQYSVTALECAAIGDTIYNQIKATDIDAGLTGQLSASCFASAGNTEACSKFNVSISNQGAGSYLISIVLAGLLDFKIQSRYSIYVEVTDVGNPPLSDRAPVSITVREKTDYLPLFVNTPISFFVQHRQPNDSVLAVVQASIPCNQDTQYQLAFSITNDPMGWFTLDATTYNSKGFYQSNIRSNGRVDSSILLNNYGGTYSFEISATNLYAGQVTTVSSTTSVTVNLMASTNNPPVFSSSTYSATVSTAIISGSFIPSLSMVVTDADTGDAGYFQLSVVSNPSPVSGIFGVVPASGQGSVAVSMTVLQPSYLGFTSPANSKYTVTVTAINNRTLTQLSGSAVVTIDVLQGSVVPPFFSQSSYSITIYDNIRPGTLSNQIQALDYNSGQYGQLRYSIISGDQSYISVDPNSCTVNLLRTPSYSTVQKLDYVLQASNGVGSSTTATLTISVLDSSNNNLKFSSPEYDGTVPELGTQFDQPVIIYVTNLQYDRNPSYMIVNQGGVPPGLFVLIVTGVAQDKRAYLNMTRGVDYNDTPNRQGFFDLTIQASDNAFPTSLKNNVSVRIFIKDTNNHVPTFGNVTYIRTIAEDTPPGTSVIQVNATDGDVAQNSLVSYKLGPGGRDNFIIDPDSGIITVAPTADLTLETNPPRYNITVYAQDRGSPPQTGTTTVYVTIQPSQKPVFDTQNYIFYVHDSAPLTTLVGTVVARVKNSLATVEYSIVPQSHKARDRFSNPVTVTSSLLNYVTMFKINVTSGSISVASQLSWNYAAVVTFQVVATNKQNANQLQTISTVTIYIDRPTIQFYPPLDPNNQTVIVAINEQVPIGSIVPYQVLAYSSNPRDVFSYLLTGNSDPTHSLNLDTNTGVITVVKNIDYESFPQPKQIPLYVIANDTSVASSSASVTVIVQIIKITKPMFNQTSYKYVIYSNTTVGSAVGRTPAVDSATGSPAVFTYTMQPAGSYTIDRNTAVISVSTSLSTSNRQTPYTDDFFVSATSVNSLGVTSTATVPVSITVLNATNSGPVFIGIPFSWNVSSTTKSNTPFGLVTSYDYWSGGKDPIHYYIIPGNDSSLFSINNQTGVIQVNQDMTNYVRTQPYVLNVSAQAGSPVRASYTLVYIYVINGTVSDGLLFITQPSLDGTVFSVPEGLKGKNIVTLVVASTTRPNVTLHYYFSVNNNLTSTSGNFSIDPDTGVVTVNGALDWNRQKSYILNLVVRDSGTPFRELTRPIVIKVNPTNLPYFKNCPLTPNPLVVHVKKDAAVGLNVTTVIACNNDATATIYYYLFTGDSPNTQPTTPFALADSNSGSSSGTIYVKGPLDIYNHPVYYLTMVAYNMSSASLPTLQNASLIAVHVIVDDVDINGPTFDNSPNPSINCAGIGKQVNRAVRDFPATGEAIVQMYAGDCDVAPENRQHSYSLTSIKFLFTSSGPSYTLSSDDNAKVQNAFFIDSKTGDVTAGLPNYRPYSFGKFQVTVTANDSQSRTDSSTLTIFTIKENDILKYAYSVSPKVVRKNADQILSNLASQSKQSNSVNVTGLDVHYHIVNYSQTLDNFGYEEWLNRPYIYRPQSDLCFYMVNGDQVLNVDNYMSAFNVEPTTVSIANDINQQSQPDRCYPHLTTHWWSGNFWVWWWLIALALLIFVIALVLIIVLCCYACKAEKNFYRYQPHVWLDPHAAQPASEFEFTGGQHLN